MSNLLVLLFAVMETRTWSVQNMAWTIDTLVRTASRPRTWLLYSCTCQSRADYLSVLRKSMLEFGMLLPADFGDLLAGLVLLRVDADELTAELARCELVEIAETYGISHVDAEAAAMIDLGDPIFVENRTIAARALEYLGSGKFSPEDWRLIDNQL